ncbi:MAG: histidinol dehydrogenase, partial [Balneolaceae bacterium]|nr:histidinol dehydrogenase [Balneolaceae bacterium]
MKHFTYHTLSDMERQELCRRPKMDFESVMEQIGPIIRDVKEKGDPAVNEWTATFDGVPPERLVVDPAETEVKLDRATREAIDTAYENIYRFHKSQLPPPLEVETMPGVRCMRITRPIERVGLYVPGGTAVLPSTLMMLGIPASLAGCEQILVATPPDQNGGVPDVIAYIAAKIGASGIVLAGGAQSVAAMAYGTQSVPKVDKILGPGNQYVTAAKMWLQISDALVAIDMPAGPSEVLVIADGSAEPAIVAADL